MQLIIAIFVLVTIPTILAWRLWLKTESSLVSHPRSVAFMTGLLVTTSALVLFAAFVAYTTHIDGFKTDFRSVLRWTRWGFWLSIAGLGFCVAGTGRSRMWATLGSLLAAILWVIPNWGM